MDYADKIGVSIICNTYNHKNYIEETLNGFLAQKTSFKYEILIHDDASTDGTTEIIREFEKAYPLLIKPIYQTENQYSKSINITQTYQIPRACGKYIAICEGDDYWIDCFKLQKQYDAMEMNPQLDICSHKVERVTSEFRKHIDFISPREENDIIPVQEVIMGEGGFVGTNSLFIRTELFNNVPEFRKKLNLDYSLQIWGALRGGMLYISDCMSAYRWLSKDSWTVRMRNDDNKKRIFYEKKREMLNQLNIDTNFIYSKIIENRIFENEFNELANLGEYKTLLTPKYKILFNKLSLNEKIKILIKAYFPLLRSVKKQFVLWRGKRG